MQHGASTFALGRAALGTMNIGDTVDESAAATMLDAALAGGITVVDTANGYAGGETERILGRLLRDRRDEVVLATKAGIPHPDAGDAAPLSERGLRASLEGSLRRLGTDRVDLFYLHQPDRETPIDETMTTLAALVDEGRIGAIGVSNFAAWQIAEVNASADRTGAPRPVVAQQLYNLVARRIEDEYVEFAAVSGLHTTVYNPLGGGLLTGRHRIDQRPTDGRFGSSRLAGMYTDRYWNDRVFTAIEGYSRIADNAGIGLVELALRWLLSKPATGSILIGASRPEQLTANLDILARGALDADVVDACDAIGADLSGSMPPYNR